MGHIRLEAQRLRHVDLLQEIEHGLPTVHAGPADLALGGQAFAVVGGDLGRFAERLGDSLGVRLGVLAPFRDAELRGIDPDHAVLANAVLVEHPRDAARHLHGIEELLAGRLVPHRRIADRAGPNRRDQRADGEAVSLNQVGDLPQVGVAGLGVGVRQKEEVVDPVELLAVHLGAGGQFEHPFETDRRLLARPISFADQPGPHGVVKFGEGLRTHIWLLIGLLIFDCSIVDWPNQTSHINNQKSYAAASQPFLIVLKPNS